MKKRTKNVSGTWEVFERHVRMGEVSGADYHCIKNTSLPLTVSALRLHLPLACRGIIQGLPHTDHGSLTHKHIHTNSAEYPQDV